MIDIRLARDFLNAIPDNAALVIVGDIDQLPSIGPGNFLRDLISSEIVPYCKLETIFRQEHGGLIVQNAHNINTGEKIEAAPPDDDSSDFYFIDTAEPDLVVERMKELVTSRIPKRFGFDAMCDIQILTPMRKNQLGTENLNAIMQEALNPKGEQINRFGRIYRKGDRVMQIRNNYDKEVFNGDIGFVVRVDTTEQVLTVEIDNRPIKYEFTDLDELILAYACTIHKSQGSEYPAVVILLTTQHFKLLQRNLLYTAITRGKQLVCLVGSSKAVNMAIRNNEILMRRTSLSERLAERGD
jgi:exodeoxyribonuclease V alpha subunit